MKVNLDINKKDLKRISLASGIGTILMALLTLDSKTYIVGFGTGVLLMTTVFFASVYMQVRKGNGGG